MAQRQPTTDICTSVAEQFGEIVTSETIDKARLIYRSKINSYLASQENANILASARLDVAIDQSMPMLAIEQQWEVVATIVKEMAQYVATELEAVDPEGKKKLLFECNNFQNILSATTGNLVRAQILMAKAAIELPYRRTQLSGQKEVAKNEITPEFLREIEGMLGVLPYEPTAEPIIIVDHQNP